MYENSYFISPENGSYLVIRSDLPNSESKALIGGTYILVSRQENPATAGKIQAEGAEDGLYYVTHDPICQRIEIDSLPTLKNRLAAEFPGQLSIQLSSGKLESLITFLEMYSLEIMPKIPDQLEHYRGKYILLSGTVGETKTDDSADGLYYITQNSSLTPIHVDNLSLSKAYLEENFLGQTSIKLNSSKFHVFIYGRTKTNYNRTRTGPINIPFKGYTPEQALNEGLYQIRSLMRTAHPCEQNISLSSTELLAYVCMLQSTGAHTSLYSTTSSMIDFLVRLGKADPLQPNGQKPCALQLAVTYGNLKAVDVLFRATPSLRQTIGLLHIALQYHKNEVASYLIETPGVDIEEKNSLGETLLLVAAETGEAQHIVRLLLRRGARLDAEPSMGKAPLLHRMIKIYHNNSFEEDPSKTVLMIKPELVLLTNKDGTSAEDCLNTSYSKDQQRRAEIGQILLRARAEAAANARLAQIPNTDRTQITETYQQALGALRQDTQVSPLLKKLLESAITMQYRVEIASASGPIHNELKETMQTLMPTAEPRAALSVELKHFFDEYYGTATDHPIIQEALQALTALQTEWMQNQTSLMSQSTDSKLDDSTGIISHASAVAPATKQTDSFSIPEGELTDEQITEKVRQIKALMRRPQGFCRVGCSITDNAHTEALAYVCSQSGQYRPIHQDTSDMIRFLVQLGQVDLQVRVTNYFSSSESSQHSLLELAASRGNLPAIQALLNESPSIPERGINLLLHIAIKHNQLDMVKYLTEQYVNYVPSPPEREINLLLHIAIRHAQLDMVKYLVENHIRCLEEKNDSDETPLLVAIATQDISLAIIEYLLQKGAELDLTLNNNEKTVRNYLDINSRNQTPVKQQREMRQLLRGAAVQAAIKVRNAQVPGSTSDKTSSSGGVSNISSATLGNAVAVADTPPPNLLPSNTLPAPSNIATLPSNDDDDDELPPVNATDPSSNSTPFRTTQAQAEAKLESENSMETFFKTMLHDIDQTATSGRLPRNMDRMNTVLQDTALSIPQKIERVSTILCETRAPTYFSNRADKTEAIYQRWIALACSAYQAIDPSHQPSTTQCCKNFSALQAYLETSHQKTVTKEPPAPV